MGEENTNNSGVKPNFNNNLENLDYTKSITVDSIVYAIKPVKTKSWLKILYGSKGDMADAITKCAHENVLVNGEKKIIEFYDEMPSKIFNQILEQLEVF